MEGIISLYDIFAQHRNWYDYKKEELTGEVWMQIKQEMAQASADFAIRLTQLGERWRNAVEKNIEKLHTTASVPAVSNKARCERYRDALKEFSICVRLALENIFTKSELNDLHPLTRYWLGYWPGWNDLRITEVHTGLSRNEADAYINKMQSFPDRRMFREIPFLGRYTVFGCKEPIKDEACANSTERLQNGADGQLAGNEQNKPLDAEGQPQETAQTINKEELKKYFQFTFFQNTPKAFNTLLEDIKQASNSKDDKLRLITIALAIYDGGLMMPTKKSNTFQEWYRVFCEIVGCEISSYKPKDVKKNDKNYLDKFPYLIKKEKGYR